MIYKAVKDMHGKHSLEDMMSAYQSVSQSCLDMRTLDYVSSGCGQIRNDQLYGGEGAPSETPGQQVSRAHSVGDLSTGLTLSLVGQRKADSMLNLTAAPLHNIEESVDRVFDSHTVENSNSTDNTVKRSQMMNTYDRSKIQTNYTAPRQRSPLKGKRSLPNVPVSEASERIKRFTELMNARMALHSSASLHTTTPLSPGGPLDPTTPPACSDSEISEIFNRKAMIRDKSNHRVNTGQSEYSVVQFDGRKASSKVNQSTECKVQSVHSVPRDHLSPGVLPNNSSYQGYVSSPKFQNHVFEPVVTSSLQPGIESRFAPRFARGDSDREKPITSSQMAHYQEMVAALNNRQTESTFKANVTNNELTRNLDTNENYSYNSVKSRPYSSQLVSSHNSHISVGLARTDQQGHRANFTCQNSNNHGNYKRYYGSQPNLNITQVRNNSEPSGQTFVSLGHSQAKLPCNLSERMERDYVNENNSHVSQPSTFLPIALGTPNPSRRKTFQFPSDLEWSGDVYKCNTLPGKWRMQTAERAGSERGVRRPPTLYQLAQVCSLHSCRVSLPPGLALQQCLYLGCQMLQVPSLHPSAPDDQSPGCGPQGHFTATLGGPGSAFRPVHRSTSSTTSVSLVSVQQVTESVPKASLPLNRGDIIVEMNGMMLIGADTQFVKTTLQKAQGEIFLTLARVKNHCTSLTVEQMMNEIDFLRAEIAERDCRLREMEARQSISSPVVNVVPNEEVEISEDEFIV